MQSGSTAQDVYHSANRTACKSSSPLMKSILVTLAQSGGHASLRAPKGIWGTLYCSCHLLIFHTDLLLVAGHPDLPLMVLT